MPFKLGPTYLTREDIERECEEMRRMSFAYREPTWWRRIWWHLLDTFTLPPKPPAPARKD